MDNSKKRWRKFFKIVENKIGLYIIQYYIRHWKEIYCDVNNTKIDQYTVNSQ